MSQGVETKFWATESKACTLGMQSSGPQGRTLLRAGGGKGGEQQYCNRLSRTARRLFGKISGYARSGGLEELQKFNGGSLLHLPLHMFANSILAAEAFTSIWAPAVVTSRHVSSLFLLLLIVMLAMLLTMTRMVMMSSEAQQGLRYLNFGFGGRQYSS